MSDDLKDPGLDSFWDAVEEAAKSSGGGHIGEVEIGFAWKVSVSGTDLPKDSGLFKYDVTGDREVNKANSALAKAKASKFVVDNGLQKDPFNFFYTILYKDTVIGRDVSSWQYDMMSFVFPNSAAYLQVILPHLQKATAEVGEKRFGKWWAKVTWAKDPDQTRARDKKDNEGNVILDETGTPVKEEKLVMHVIKLYKNKDEAMADAGGHGSSDDVPPITNIPVKVDMPDGYDEETWKMTVKEIRNEFQSGTLVMKLVKSYELPKATIEAVVADLRK